jgi:HD-like signal output (HDOD) protein
VEKLIMFWFLKKKHPESSKEVSAVSNKPSGKSHPPEPEKLILYSLGTVINVEPPNRFEIRGFEDDRNYFVIAKGSANLYLNDSALIRTLKEGEWISTEICPKSRKFFLSLRSMQEFKLVRMSFASVEGVDSATKESIERCIRVLSKDVRKSVSKLDSFEESIGEFVRLNLRQRSMSHLARYESSSFIQNAIAEVTSLPAMTQHFVSLGLSDGVSNAELSAFIKNNPSLATEILKTVNSSYHGMRNRVQDISYAVLFLGVSQVLQIVVSASMKSITGGSPQLDSLYSHSTLISNVSSLLVENKDKRISPVAATIGILHEVGEILKALMKEKHQSLDLLVDHLSGAKMGAMLLKGWGIPELICKVIEASEQSPYTLPDELDDEVRDFVACLHACHSVCSFVEDETLSTDPITQAYLSQLGFDEMNIEQLLRFYLVPKLRSNVNRLPVDVQVFFSI